VLNPLRRIALPALWLLLAGPASAQDTTLDGLWFKLKVKIKGEAAVPDVEAPKKVSLTATAYLRLTITEPSGAGGEIYPDYAGTTYAYELWMETAPDFWELVYNDAEDIESASPTRFFLSDTFFTVKYMGGGAADCYVTSAIKVKFDKQGAFTSATFRSLGGEAYVGTTDGTDAFRGGIVITGKSVDPEKLPFVPE
jgi:hypothetical protein